MRFLSCLPSKPYAGDASRGKIQPENGACRLCSISVMNALGDLMDRCPCGSGSAYQVCCKPILLGEREAATAEQLMRSRYSAYVMKEIDYLRRSLHPDHRSDFNEETTRAWAERSAWHKLDILGTAGGGMDDHEGTVDFIATFTDNGTKREHHERSSFRKESGIWYLVEGTVLPPRQVVRAAPKTGRNDPCPCGSGRKFKKCCER